MVATAISTLIVGGGLLSLSKLGIIYELTLVVQGFEANPTSLGDRAFVLSVIYLKAGFALLLQHSKPAVAMEASGLTQIIEKAYLFFR